MLYCFDALSSDSYYEYLIKSHIVTEGAESEWAGYWLEVVDTILDVLVVDVPGFGKIPTSTEKRLVDKSQRKLLSSGRIEMDHFSCFLPVRKTRFALSGTPHMSLN